MIEHIEIRNFKSIKELDLNLKPINVLIGANGVGKSNFISFFKLLKNLQNDTLNTYVVSVHRVLKTKESANYRFFVG